MWRRRAKPWILPMPMKTNDSTEKWTWWPDTKPRHCSACQSTSKTASSASSNSSTKRVAYSPARTNRLVLPSACTYLTIATTITAKWAIFGTVAHILILKYVLASVYEGLSVGWLVGRSDGRSVACFLKCQYWTVFFMKDIEKVRLRHCWMSLVRLTCLMCIKSLITLASLKVVQDVHKYTIFLQIEPGGSGLVKFGRV